MKRIEKIRRHPEFIRQMKKISADERNREFCGHDMQHLLDVARIGYSISLERGLDLDKELIYAAALLHDLGRHLQYADGIPHAVAGAKLAKRIMIDCGFSDEESKTVAAAIAGHSASETKAKPATLAMPGKCGIGDRCRERPGSDRSRDITNLGLILYIADKKSRPCYDCKARDKCNWPPDRMNMQIEY